MNIYISYSLGYIEIDFVRSYINKDFLIRFINLRRKSIKKKKFSKNFEKKWNENVNSNKTVPIPSNHATILVLISFYFVKSTDLFIKNFDKLYFNPIVLVIYRFEFLKLNYSINNSILTTWV